MSRDLGRHQCPVEGCRILLNAKLMCLDHWRMVGVPLQQAVYAAYDHGAGIGTEELYHAQDAAITAVETKLAARKEG